MQIVIFTNPKHCAPCRLQESELTKAHGLGLPREAVAVVDVTDPFDAFKVSYYEIQATPTLVVINDQKKEVYRHVGALKAEELLALVQDQVQ